MAPTGVPCLKNAAEIGAFLREPDHYPLFAKPIDGKYSLCILNGDAIDRASDRIRLRCQAETSVNTAAAERQASLFNGAWPRQPACRTVRAMSVVGAPSGAANACRTRDPSRRRQNRNGHQRCR